MIRSKLISLEKRLLQRLPGFAVKNRLIIVSPMAELVRGLSFEGSQYNDRSFYLTKFVMPLYIPKDYLYFNFGDRVRRIKGSDRWNIEATDVYDELMVTITAQALPFLLQIRTLDDFLRNAEAHPRNVRTLEAIGYTYARQRNAAEAINSFDELLAKSDLNVQWQRDLADRVRVLRIRLIDEPDAVQAELAKLEDEVARKLGLEEFRQAS